jgi:uncharacterized protein
MTDFDPELLEMLACPETKEPVRLANASLIDKLNAAQKAGTLRTRGGKTVAQPLQEGFIREDRAYLYPVVDGIPVMLIEEAIPLGGFV